MTRRINQKAAKRRQVEEVAERQVKKARKVEVKTKDGKVEGKGGKKVKDVEEVVVGKEGVVVDRLVGGREEAREAHALLASGEQVPAHLSPDTPPVHLTPHLST